MELWKIKFQHTEENSSIIGLLVMTYKYFKIGASTIVKLWFYAHPKVLSLSKQHKHIPTPFRILSSHACTKKGALPWFPRKSDYSTVWIHVHAFVIDVYNIPFCFFCFRTSSSMFPSFRKKRHPWTHTSTIFDTKLHFHPKSAWRASAGECELIHCWYRWSPWSVSSSLTLFSDS